MIDQEGFRLNVGIIVSNNEGKLLWARRVSPAYAWQFPQGGILEHETPEQAMFRELEEELGLLPDHVQCIAESKDWLTYLLPPKYRRYHSEPLCIGQKQKWFLLRTENSDQIRLDHSQKPEFNEWLWVDYWYPAKHVVVFKRSVYRTILNEFENLVRG